MDVDDASGGAPDIGDAGVSSLDGETSTAALVRNLVRCTLASHGASDAPDASVERMFRYAVRLVGSSLSADVEPDEDAAADEGERTTPASPRSTGTPGARRASLATTRTTARDA